MNLGYIFDDRGKGHDYQITKILYEDEDVILANAENDNFIFKVMILKFDNSVHCKDLNFYYYIKP